MAGLNPFLIASANTLSPCAACFAEGRGWETMARKMAETIGGLPDLQDLNHSRPPRKRQRHSSIGNFS